MSCELILLWHGGPRDVHEHPDVPLDPCCRFRIEECKEIAAEVLAGRRRASQTFGAALLGQAALEYGTTCVSYSRRVSWYSGRSPGARTVIGTIDDLEAMGLIETHKPRHSADGFQSVLAAGPRLVERLDLEGEVRGLKPLCARDFTAKRFPITVCGPVVPRPAVSPVGCVLSRRRRGELVCVAGRRSSIREEVCRVQQLNDFLCDVDIDLRVPTSRHGFVEFKPQPDKARRSLVHRVNLGDRSVVASHVALRNDRWKYGGRLYGGYWQSTPRWARSGIRPDGEPAKTRRPGDIVLLHIDGDPTVEPDFRCLHADLLYASVELDPDGDPYVVDGFSRDDGKIALNALVNASSVESAIRVLADHRRDKPGLERPLAERLVAELRRRNRPIDHLLGRDAGIVLQNVDGRTCLEICCRLFGEGIPVLPVHDSFVSRERDAARVEEVMLEELDKAKSRLPSEGLRLPA